MFVCLLFSTSAYQCHSVSNLFRLVLKVSKTWSQMLQRFRPLIKSVAQYYSVFRAISEAQWCGDLLHRFQVKPSVLAMRTLCLKRLQ